MTGEKVTVLMFVSVIAVILKTVKNMKTYIKWTIIKSKYKNFSIPDLAGLAIILSSYVSIRQDRFFLNNCIKYTSMNLDCWHRGSECI